MKAFNQGAMTLLGVSRKSFLGPLTNIDDASQRDHASLGAMAAGVISGAHVLRVHNVKAAFDMTRVLDACLNARKIMKIYTKRGDQGQNRFIWRWTGR